METGRDASADDWQVESAQLRMNLLAYIAPDASIEDGRGSASQAIKDALIDQNTSDLAAIEMVTAYEALAEKHTQGTVLYAYYSLVKNMADMHPEVSVPKSLLAFIEQQAVELEEFSIVVELGTMDRDALEALEKTEAGNPIEVFVTYINQKRKELEAYVASVTSDLYRAYSEKAADFANYTGESYALEKDIMDRYRGKPAGLRNAIAAGQIRTDQAMAAARLQHDCDMISHHSGSLFNQKDDISQQLLLTAEGRMALAVQFDHGLINTIASEPEKYKGLVRKDLRILAAKSLAAALYDKHLIDRANGDIVAMHDDLINYRYLTKQAKEAVRRIIST